MNRFHDTHDDAVRELDKYDFHADNCASSPGRVVYTSVGDCAGDFCEIKKDGKSYRIVFL